MTEQNDAEQVGLETAPIANGYAVEEDPFGAGAFRPSNEAIREILRKAGLDPDEENQAIFSSADTVIASLMGVGTAVATDGTPFVGITLLTDDGVRTTRVLNPIEALRAAHSIIELALGMIQDDELVPASQDPTDDHHDAQVETDE